MRSEKNGKSILLVEDEAEVRSYLEMSLRCEGYTVESAGDGVDALLCLQNASPPISAVLLDIIMPRQDGMETLREDTEPQSGFAGHHGIRGVFPTECRGSHALRSHELPGETSQPRRTSQSC